MRYAKRVQRMTPKSKFLRFKLLSQFLKVACSVGLCSCFFCVNLWCCRTRKTVFYQQAVELNAVLVVRIVILIVWLRVVVLTFRFIGLIPLRFIVAKIGDIHRCFHFIEVKLAVISHNLSAHRKIFNTLPFWPFVDRG